MDRLPNQLRPKLSTTDTNQVRQHQSTTEAPSLLLSQPEEVIACIIGKLDKADNASLSSLVRTCKELARIVSTDALLSFFYAAKEAYDGGNTAKKAEVFCHLVDWLQEISSQLPDESVFALLDHLVMMSVIDCKEIHDRRKLHQQTAFLYKCIFDPEKSPIHAVQRVSTQRSDATDRITPMSLQLMIQLKSLYTTGTTEINEAIQRDRAILGMPHD